MAEELQAGRAFVDLVPRLTPGGAAAAQAQMGGLFGGLSSQARTAGLAIGTGLLAGGALVGAAGLAVGTAFDDAFDTIRIGTGATGSQLEGLENTFRGVAGNVSDDFGRVSTAVADLNTRTGLTGPALEGLATQVLTLSRITGEDLSTTIETQTRLFGDWGTSTAEQAETLDYLFRVSQATGIGVNDLSGSLVRFGAPLRQLGFGLEESAALLGAFEREGVNADLVMGSFRQALGRMARAGEPAVETLGRVMESIQGAGSTSEANAIALELFGARAGPDMAAAIREGRFAVDDLVAQLSGSEETILGVAEETDDFSEKFSKLRNRIFLALEPLGELTFEVLNRLADVLLPVVSELGDRLPGALAAVADAARPWLERAREIVANFREDFLPIATRIVDFVREHLRPILIGLGAALALLVSPVGAVAAALVLAYQRSETFRNIVDAVVSFIVNTVAPRVAQFVGFLVAQFSNLVGWVREHWGSISEAISHVVNVVEAIVRGFVDAVLLVWSYFGDTLLAVISGAWQTIRAVVEFAVDFVRGIIEAALAIINGEWGEAWDAIVGILSSAWDLIASVIDAGWDVVRNLIFDGLEAAKDLFLLAFDEIVGFFADLPGRLVEAAGDLFGFLWESFRSALNLIIRAWNALEFEIPGFDPPGPGSFPGFTLGVPDIPELAEGGHALRSGWAIVGEEGPELLDLTAGADVVPLDVAAMLAGAALEGNGVSIGRLEVLNPIDATADEVVAAIGAKLGWTLTTRKDG